MDFEFLNKHSDVSCTVQANKRKRIQINENDATDTEVTEAPSTGIPQHSTEGTQIIGKNTFVISEIDDAAGKKRVLSVKYEKDCILSDFRKMVLQRSFRHTSLFVIFENYLHQRMGYDVIGNGGGSASIREYTYPAGKDDGVFVIGIATGWSITTGGFTNLGQRETTLIDLQFKAVQTILLEHPTIQNVIFPCSDDDYTRIGSKIFKPSNDVIEYISMKLADVFSPHNMLSKQRQMDAINAAQTRNFDDVALTLDCGTKLAKSMVDIMHAVPRDKKDKIWRLLREWYSLMKTDTSLNTYQL